VIDFLKIPIENASIGKLLGPVVESGQFLIQAAEVEYHLWEGEVQRSDEIGNWMLSARFRPPQALKMPLNSGAHVSAWAGGRIRRLFFEGPVENLNTVHFVCTLNDEPTQGWYFMYTCWTLYPMIYFGSKAHPSMPKKHRLKLVKALFNKLIENKTELVDYEDSIEDDDCGGTFGVANGIPFCNFASDG